MLDTFILFDRWITAQISSLLPHSAFFDGLFSFFSLHGLTFIIWVLLFFIFWYQERKDKTHHHFFFAFAASFGLTSIMVNYVLKNVFLRARPWIIQGIMNTGCPSDYSFPSGHASGAFAGAVVFAYFDKKRALLYYGIATLISLSRVYLGCHYMLDVVFGALIGYLIGKVAIWLLSSRKIL